MFLVAVIVALALGGAFAMALRTKLLAPGPWLMEPTTAIAINC